MIINFAVSSLNKKFVSYNIFESMFELFHIRIVMKATFASDNTE